jgi:hypothetical protein
MGMGKVWWEGSGWLKTMQGTTDPGTDHRTRIHQSAHSTSTKRIPHERSTDGTGLPTNGPLDRFPVGERILDSRDDMKNHKLGRDPGVGIIRRHVVTVSRIRYLFGRSDVTADIGSNEWMRLVEILFAAWSQVKGFLSSDVSDISPGGGGGDGNDRP